MRTTVEQSDDGARSDVLAHVSSNLRRLRRAAGLSQDALALSSGLSRRMIGSLEGGDTNISLSSLDKLADALGVDFAAMISDPHADSKRIDAIGWRGKKLDSVATLLGSAPASREAQLWHWTLAEGETYHAEPDPIGWHEMVFVTEGCLTIAKDDGTITITSGNFSIYSSAQHYAYVNQERSPVRFIRIVAS